MNHINIVFLTIYMFIAGSIGLIQARNNLLIVVINLELIYLSIIINLVFTSKWLYSESSLVLSIILIVIAASETAISLALLVLAYKLSNNANMVRWNELRG